MRIARFILLDAGVDGLLCSSPSLPNARACSDWLARIDVFGTIVVLTDLTLDEVRREMVRIDSTAKLVRLDALRTPLAAAPVTSEAWLLAGNFWALLRKAGIPTAAPHALDADAILAAAARTLAGPGDSSTIATTNVDQPSALPDGKNLEGLDIPSSHGQDGFAGGNRKAKH